jgi:hypothetical protein
MSLSLDFELTKPAWVKEAEQILNGQLPNPLSSIELDVKYNRAGKVVSAEWLAPFSSVSRMANTFAALQDAGYYLEVEPPNAYQGVFENRRKITIRPAFTFEGWARQVAPERGKGSLLNRKNDGVPQHWLVLGWFYDLLLKETQPRLIVRQFSSLARYNGLYYLAGFKQENTKYKREVVQLHRTAPLFGKTNPYLYFHLSADDKEEPTDANFDLLQSWQAELGSITRSRRDLFGLHRREAAIRRLAVQRLPKVSFRSLQWWSSHDISGN